MAVPLPLPSIPYPVPVPAPTPIERIPFPINPQSISRIPRIGQRIDQIINNINSKYPNAPWKDKLIEMLKKTKEILSKIWENIVHPLIETIAPDLVFQYLISIPFLLKKNGYYKNGVTDYDTFNQLLDRASRLMILGGSLSALTGSDLGEELIESLVEPIVEERFKNVFTTFQKIKVGGMIPELDNIETLLQTGNINQAKILGLLASMSGLDNYLATELAWQLYMEGNWSYVESVEGNINWLAQTAVNENFVIHKQLLNIIFDYLRNMVSMLVEYFDYWVSYDEVITHILTKLGELMRTIIATDNDTTINNVYAQILRISSRLQYIEQFIDQLTLPDELVQKFTSMLTVFEQLLEKYYDEITKEWTNIFNIMIDSLNNLLQTYEQYAKEIYNTINMLRS